MDERKEFERVASDVPFELALELLPDESEWPGAYKSYATHLAWSMWKERANLDSDRRVRP